MKRWKIVLTRSMVAGDITYIKNGIKSAVDDCFDFILPETYDEDGICAVASDADIYLGPYVTEKTIAAAPNLRLVQVPWTGMDTFDFASAKTCKCPICNTHSNADSVAELAVTLVLDLLKKVSYHDRKMRNGNWNREQQPLDLQSRMVAKQRICLLGYGQIGSRIGKMLAGMGADIVAVNNSDRSAREELSASVPFEKWTELVPTADIVICTLPLTDVTHNMIDIDTMQYLKNGSMLVNMSRAAIVNEEAAYMALNSGRLSGFASDVWWNAPKRGESRSWPSAKFEFTKFDNVIFSPHRAGFVEGELPHLDGAIDNIVRLITGREILCKVDMTKQY